MFSAHKNRHADREAARRRDDLFAEAVTGWATNRLFPIPNLPNRYFRLPWRRIFRHYGAIRGALFISKTLTLWPFELLVEIVQPDRKLRAKNLAPQFNPGDHVCFLYRGEQALHEMLTRFVAEGLAKGEQCVCVETLRVQERLSVALRALGIDVEKQTAAGALIFVREEDVYFGGGAFNPDALVNQLGSLIDGSLQTGFSGFRVSGEISRAADDPALQLQVIEYERKVDAYFAGRKAAGFCHYRTDRFPESMLESVIEAHTLHMLEAHPNSR